MECCFSAPRAVQKVQTFKSFKTINGLFDGLNDLNVLNDLNPGLARIIAFFEVKFLVLETKLAARGGQL